MSSVSCICSIGTDRYNAARAEAEGGTDGEGEGERLGRVLRRSLSLNPNHVAAGTFPPLPDGCVLTIVPQPPPLHRTSHPPRPPQISRTTLPSSSPLPARSSAAVPVPRFAKQDFPATEEDIDLGPLDALGPVQEREQEASKEISASIHSNPTTLVLHTRIPMERGMKRSYGWKTCRSLTTISPIR